MTRKITTTLTIAVLLLVSQLSFAGATEDLWKALKAANDKDALAAIAAGADVNNIDASSSTPLSLAACFSGGEVVKALIDGKANINYVQPSNGFTPLFNAANWGNTEAIKLLLAAGADVKIKNKLGATLLSVAVMSVKLEIVKLLVEAGCDPAEVYKATGQEWTALLMLTTAYPPVEKVKNIQANKAAITQYGLTYPERLINAKESDFTPLGEIAEYLLSKGANPSIAFPGWGSVLNRSIDLGKLDIAKALIAAKADLTVTMRYKGKVGGFNCTPLMLASLNGYNELVEMMCKAGADVNIVAKEMSVDDSYSVGTTSTTHYQTVTKKYNNALSLALGNKKSETADILKKYGAKEPK